MKNHLRNVWIFSISVAVMAVIFAACENQNENDAAQSASFEMQIEEIDVTGMFNPIKLKGSVDYWVSERGDLVLLSATKGNQHIFLLQGFQGKKLDFGTISTLSFYDHSILLHTNLGYFYIGVDKKETRDVLTKLPSEIQANAIVYDRAVSLIHQTISKNSERFESLNLADLRSSSDAVAYLSGSDWSTRTAGWGSGGTGSTSCSNAYCSVSCSIGYYACCNIPHFPNPASCVCIKSPTP